MRVERITVTTTPTSIKALMDAQRTSDKARIPKKCKNILLKYDVAEALPIYLTDSETTNQVKILDNATENIRSASFDDWDISLMLLSVTTGTVEVDVIVSQRGT